MGTKEEANNFISVFSNKTEEDIENYISDVQKTDKYTDIDEGILEIVSNESLSTGEKSYRKRLLEKKKHSLFVEECLNPKGYLDGEETVFARINTPIEDADEESREIEYHISLITPYMAYTDYMYYEVLEEGNPENPWWYKEYRPYMFEISVVIDRNDKEWMRFINEVEDNFFITKIYSSKKECEEAFRIGQLHFEGSDRISDEVKILLKDEPGTGYKDKLRHLFKDIFNKYNPPMDLKSFLDSVLGNTSQNSFFTDILNVGQANCIHVRVNSILSFLFDIGKPLDGFYDKNDKKWRKNNDYAVTNCVNKEIGKMALYKPNFIIISHWHYDHYAGIYNMSNDGIDSYIIAPELLKSTQSVNCLRIGLYAMKHKRLIMVDNPGKELYSNGKDNIKLFQGLKNSSSLNDNGLILQIRDTLFCGDSLYRNWPNSLKSNLGSIDRIVVPHHGSEIEYRDKTILKSFVNMQESIICFGDNTYSHPNKEHIDELFSLTNTPVKATGGARNLPYNGAKVGNVDIKNNTISITI